MTARISLAEQIESVRFAETRQRALNDGKAIKELRGEAKARKLL